MEKINTDKLFEDSMFEESERWEKDHKIAEFKDTIRERGILPILKDGKLFIYKISGKIDISKLRDDYNENMFDIYNVIVLNDQKFKSDLCRSSYLPFFRNMLIYRTSTTEEIWEKFHLSDEQNKEDFIEKNAQEVEIHIPIDATTYTKGYRKEKIHEIVQRIAKDYVTCFFKRKSKLSAIIDFIGVKNYFDLDFIAAITCEFLNSNAVNFSSGTTILREERSEIDRMQFTDKEKSLSEEEKIALIKNIIAALNIECVYCEEVDKISDFQLESILGTNSLETVIDFSKHNADILYNSVFSTIYSKIISSNPKTLEKK